MSAASTPVPRSKSTSESRTSGPRGHTLFWPMLIFLVGAGSLALYQVMAMEDQLDEITQSIDKMDGKVKRAQYEKAKFYAIARDVLSLAPKDPNAEQVAVDFKLRQLQAAQPARAQADRRRNRKLGAHRRNHVALSRLFQLGAGHGTDSRFDQPLRGNVQQAGARQRPRRRVACAH